MSRTPGGARADKAPTRSITGAPRKRYRRTNAELEALRDALYDIVQEHRPATVRQVFYLSVVRDLCPKDENGYDLIQRELLKLRRTGVVPYGWIADNIRASYGRIRYGSLEEFGAIASEHLYHYDYWRDVEEAVEVWVESDSIVGAIKSTVINDWGLRLHVARGFSSETYLYNAGEEIQEDGRPTHVYVLSDFDPSGISLAEDIADKLERFSGDVPVSVERIALSGDQVRAWDLPTHALKASDGRAARFRREHGHEACELEAVPPNMLRRLVSDCISRHVSPERILAAKRTEQVEREALLELPEWFRGRK